MSISNLLIVFSEVPSCYINKIDDGINHSSASSEAEITQLFKKPIGCELVWSKLVTQISCFREQ